MKLSSFAKLFGLGVALAAGPLLAHGDHCHVVDENGVLSDYTAAKTKTACAAVKNSVWMEHPHCLIKNTTGKNVSSIAIHTKDVCLSQNGKWEDHPQKAEH
jgi:hypothetical protein